MDPCDALPHAHHFVVLHIGYVTLGMINWPK